MRKLAIAVGVLFALLAGLAGHSFYRFFHGSPEHVIMSWYDSEHDITFSITEKEMWWENISKLVVEESSYIDDKMWWGEASFVRYGDWLLVLNDDHVVSGYNYKTKKAVNDYRELPFTVRKDVGEIVLSRRCGDKAKSGRGFPRAIESNVGQPQTHSAPASNPANAGPSQSQPMTMPSSQR